jgi:hypothetical protein
MDAGRLAVANQVYVYTHQRLTAFVPERTASRVLLDVLMTHGETVDSISGLGMSELLLGPVFQELKDSIPRDSLKRNLRELAAYVRDWPKVVTASGATPLTKETLRSIITFDPEETTPPLAAQSSVATNKVADLGAPAIMLDEVSVKSSVTPVAGGAVTGGAVAGARAAAPDQAGVRASQAGVVSSGSAPAVPQPAPVQRTTVLATPPVKREPLSLDKLEKAILKFAQLENVKLVAAVRADGEVAVSRGTGVELSALSRLGLMALRLLKRSGDLRSYYLAHTQGQLFLLTLGSDTLIVMGSSEVNLGAVFATLSTIKEEI